MKDYPWLSAAWSGFQNRLNSGQLPHAMLIQGPEGSGKSMLARQMAARLMCTAELEFACGECRSCTLFEGGAHPDYFGLAPEEGKHQIVIDQVRSTIAALALTTSFSPRKVAMICPAEAMNNNSANALLKSLEEPPGETVLILVSHDASRLPVTIRSRCQSIAIPLPGAIQATQWLVEHEKMEPGAAAAALEAAGGSPLRALQIAQSGQVVIHQGLLKMLAGLLVKPAMASKVAGDLADVDANALWTWLSNGCADALRAVMVGRSPAWLDNAPDMDSKGLALLQLNADRNRMLATTPVRQDLLLQEWLIKWSQLAK